eukprot:2260660-Rhodomonas_salina.6
MTHQKEEDLAGSMGGVPSWLTSTHLAEPKVMRSSAKPLLHEFSVTQRRSNGAGIGRSLFARHDRYLAALLSTETRARIGQSA